MALALQYTQSLRRICGSISQTAQIILHVISGLLREDAVRWSNIWTGDPDAADHGVDSCKGSGQLLQGAIVHPPRE